MEALPEADRERETLPASVFFTGKCGTLRACTVCIEDERMERK